MPYHENWDCKLGEELDDDGDPPRVWNQDLEYPGTAFTRSIGDSLAESLGVIAEPELDSHRIGAADRVIIAASDGIFEFITTRTCVETALLYNDPLEACKALVGESSARPRPRFFLSFFFGTRSVPRDAGTSSGSSARTGPTTSPSSSASSSPRAWATTRAPRRPRPTSSRPT